MLRDVSHVAMQRSISPVRSSGSLFCRSVIEIETRNKPRMKNKIAMQMMMVFLSFGFFALIVFSCVIVRREKKPRVAQKATLRGFALRLL